MTSAYLAAQRPTSGATPKVAKTLTQMAAELGTTKNTVRRWHRRDHWDLWMDHWASADELWEAALQDRTRLLHQHGEVTRHIHERRLEMLVVDLDRLTNEVGIMA